MEAEDSAATLGEGRLKGGGEGERSGDEYSLRLASESVLESGEREREDERDLSDLERDLDLEV